MTAVPATVKRRIIVCINAAAKSFRKIAIPERKTTIQPGTNTTIAASDIHQTPAEPRKALAGQKHNTHAKARQKVNQNADLRPPLREDFITRCAPPDFQVTDACFLPTLDPVAAEVAETTTPQQQNQATPRKQ